MKKIFLVLLITVFALAGCANRTNTSLGEANDAQTEATQKDTEGGSDVEDETDENDDIDEDDITQDEQGDSQGEEDSSDGDMTEDSSEPDYEAILSKIVASLPQGASLGEMLLYEGIMAGHQVNIQRDGYVCENEYQELLDFNDFLVTPGAVCFASTDLDPTAVGDTWVPVLMMRASEGSYNFEQIGDVSISEDKFVLFTNTTIGENKIPEEDWYTYFWVICRADVEFDDPNEDLHHSTWVFLSQECFTKEEAVAIAEAIAGGSK